MVDGADHSGISIASEPYGATFSSERALSYDPIPRKLEPHNCNPSERQAKLSTAFLQHRCGGMMGAWLTSASPGTRMFGPGKREPLAINRGYARCDAGFGPFRCTGRDGSLLWTLPSPSPCKSVAQQASQPGLRASDTESEGRGVTLRS